MIENWLAPVLSWLGLSIVPFLLLILIIILLVKD